MKGGRKVERGRLIEEIIAEGRRRKDEARRDKEGKKYKEGKRVKGGRKLKGGNKMKGRRGRRVEV